MPVISNFERKIINLIKGNRYDWFTVGVNLGGVPGASGGSGGPPGGFIGQLIQSKVTYDTTEAESMYVPPSGMSLLHNLNRIRYRIAEIEYHPSGLVIEENDAWVASGVTTLNFEGAISTTDEGSNKVTVSNMWEKYGNDVNYDGRVYINQGDSGVTASAGIDLIIEDTSLAAIALNVPVTGKAGIYFGYPGSDSAGRILYNWGNKDLRIYVDSHSFIEMRDDPTNEQPHIEINYGLRDIDFRVHGDVNTDILFVDASDEYVQFGTYTRYTELSSSPSTPASGYFTVYAEENGKLYGKNDAGTVYDLTISGGNGISILEVQVFS